MEIYRAFLFIHGKKKYFRSKLSKGELGRNIRKRMNMKKICLLAVSLLVLVACGKKPTNALSLTGEIKGLGTDTLYIYGTDLLYGHTDTLVVREDRFAAELDIDTLTAAWLQFSNGMRYPIYLDKGKKLNVKGSAGDMESIEITGNLQNDELTAFHRELAELAQPSAKAKQEKAEAYIRSHPTSLVSIHLLEKYFVQTAQPDYSHIHTLINSLAGTLRDQPYITGLLEDVQNAEKVVEHRIAPFIQMNNDKGERITRNSFKNKYLLIHFWASWDSQSMQMNQELRRIYRQERKNEDFAMWGISLDLDRQAWKDAIRRDTLSWEQCCSFNGWNSQPVKQVAITSLPANLLLNPSGRIEGKNLDAAAIEKKLQQIKEQKQREKATRRKR